MSGNGWLLAVSDGSVERLAGAFRAAVAQRNVAAQAGCSRQITLLPLPIQPCNPASLTPSVRGYSRPGWVLPRALSPLIPVFLLATVYWGLGNNIDVAHVTSIAGVSAGGGGVGGGETDWAVLGWSNGLQICTVQTSRLGLDVHMTHLMFS